MGDPLNFHGMRKAVLLYNARSGGRRSQRQSDLQSALKILLDAGVEASLVLTQSSADATEQARKAILEGCDTVFACGGDGTIHDVLQGMAGTRVALGIIAMGTANALAHDLRLPLEPSEAVRAALDAEPRRIALGRVQVRGFDRDFVIRYFTVAVGLCEGLAPVVFSSHGEVCRRVGWERIRRWAKHRRNGGAGRAHPQLRRCSTGVSAGSVARAA